jgi:dTDP-4-dehydrorhamnose reductase
MVSQQPGLVQKGNREVMKEFLVFGRSGQLATELKNVWGSRCKALGRQDCNIYSLEDIEGAIKTYTPSVIINAAAFTAVDKAESESAECHRLNVEAAGLIAKASFNAGLPHILYSTDYVFDGSKSDPYVESDKPNPLNVYGKSKLEAEQLVLKENPLSIVLRTSWVYGSHGQNFLRTMLKVMAERSEVRVVNDQWGAPTTSIALAQGTASLAELGKVRGRSFWEKKAGIYNMTAQGRTTWFGFAEKILANYKGLQKIPCQTVLPIPSTEYPTPAKRPTNSLLSGEKFYNNFGFVLPNWEEEFEDVWKQIVKVRLNQKR